jgi:hypothetical protein
MPRIGKYGKPRVRDAAAEAYQSADKSQFRTKLSIVLDFSDVNRSIRKVRKSMMDVNDQAYKLNKSLNATKKGYGIYISSDMVADRNGEKNQVLSFNLPGMNNEAEFSSALEPLLKEIGQKGKSIMQGKYATRRETGLMNSSVGYMQRRTGKDRAVVEIGWVRKWQKYFGWQEMGTSTGIKPMGAILRTSMEMQKETKDLYSRYFRKTFLEKGR